MNLNISHPAKKSIKFTEMMIKATKSFILTETFDNFVYFHNRVILEATLTNLPPI